MDSYKRLEKLCSEIYGNCHGVTSYIDEMKSIPNGTFYVRDWDTVLRQLKHYRWVRNQIVHDPGCTEGNMCDVDDAQWLDSFYSRIMLANDPLALYRIATQSKTVQTPRTGYSSAATRRTYPQYSKYEKGPTQNAGCLTCILTILLIASAVLLIANIF